MTNTIHDIWLHNPVQFSRSTWKDISDNQLIHISLKLMSIVFSHLSCLSKLPLRRETVKSHCTTKQRYTCCALFLHGRQVRKEKQNQLYSTGKVTLNDKYLSFIIHIKWNQTSPTLIVSSLLHFKTAFITMIIPWAPILYLHQMFKRLSLNVSYVRKIYKTLQWLLSNSEKSNTNFYCLTFQSNLRQPQPWPVF